jgi:Holliday junction resolvase RusA-like endonuclease
MTTFFVPGAPKGKGRPRLGKGRTYTPAATVAEERRIGQYAMEAWRQPPTARACTVLLNIVMPVPSSWSKAKQAAALENKTAMGKPDIDNILKLYLDAMTGIVWLDDTQVVAVVCAKVYGEPGVRVQVNT